MLCANFLIVRLAYEDSVAKRSHFSVNQMSEAEVHTSRRRSRWDPSGSKAFIPNVPLHVPVALSKDAMDAFLSAFLLFSWWLISDAYLVRARLEEIAHKISSGQLDLIPERDRSPSPPPTYDRSGKRINTREQRAREKLNIERQRLIEQASVLYPGFRVRSFSSRSYVRCSPNFISHLEITRQFRSGKLERSTFRSRSIRATTSWAESSVQEEARRSSSKRKQELKSPSGVAVRRLYDVLCYVILFSFNSGFRREARQESS